MGECDDIGRERTKHLAAGPAKPRAGIFALLFLFVLYGSVLYPLPVREQPAGGGGDTPTAPAASGGSEEPDIITMTGRITIKGSMPRTMVVLTVTDGSGRTGYQIVGPLSDEIGRLYQNKLVTVRGRIVREALGPGFPAELEAESCEPARTQ